MSSSRPRRTKASGSIPRRVLSLLCVSVAITLCQDSDQPIVPYDRGLYEHWTDDDGDCANTRQEVLIAESQSPAKLDSTRCRVLEGLWFDPYTGQRITDPSDLDIDHLIPLAEAHRSGASSWTAEQRREFANDLIHPDVLIAVATASNRSKGDRDPALWLPPNEGYRCQYVRLWVIAKATWGLDMDPAEREAVREVLWNCGVVSGRDSAEGQPGPEPESDRNRVETPSNTVPEQSTTSSGSARGAGTAIDSGTAEPLGLGTGDTPDSTAVEGGAKAFAESADAFCEQLARAPCIDVNTANLETLQCAMGLGPVKSQDIIDHRTSNGLFQELEDLDDVPGIGPSTVNSIRESGFCVAAEGVSGGAEPAKTPQP